jgi:hypothetical protein
MDLLSALTMEQICKISEREYATVQQTLAKVLQFNQVNHKVMETPYWNSWFDGE